MGSEEIKKQKAEKYFSDLTASNGLQGAQGGADSLSEKIALRVSISNIQKEYGYNIQLINKMGGGNALLGSS